MPNDNMVTDEQKLQALQEAEDRKKAEALEMAEERKKARRALDPNRKRPTQYTASGLTKEQLAEMIPEYNDIGPKPEHFGIKKIKWTVNKFKERHKLRKNLKKKYGITRRVDFEEIAQQLGIGINNPVLALLAWFFSWLLGGGGLASIIGGAALLLAIISVYSFIVQEAGSFTIQLTPKLMDSGFVLSNDPTFEKVSARFDSEAILGAAPITIGDIDYDVDQIDGPHNGRHFIAYTFYIKNTSDKVQAYEYEIQMKEATLGTDKAVWLMLFEDGKQLIYTAPYLDKDGNVNSKRSPEKLSGYVPLHSPPFFSSSYYSEPEWQKEDWESDRERQYYQKADGTWGIKTTPTVDEHLVMRGLMTDIEPNEVHKYTVVLWLEGNDPECTDDLFGGYAKYHMEFSPVDTSKIELLRNVYRSEYQGYQELDDIEYSHE